MTDLLATPRMRLFTTWGTVLYIDTETGELRHGPSDRSPANAAFASNGAVGQIIHEVAGSFQPIVCSGDRCLTIGRVGNRDGVPAPALFESVQLPEKRIALRAKGLILCAEPDGRVTLSRQACGPWESFLPSPPMKHGREGHFPRRRVIVIHHRGNLANKMLQYMGALTMASRIRDCTIVNVSIPEWGIEIPDDTQHEVFFDNLEMWWWDPFRPQIEELCATANRSQSIRLVMGDYLQRMEFFMAPEFYNEIFPGSPLALHEVGAKDLLINIRSGDILGGVPHYPLLPIAFYEDIVAKMGLTPVFCGQLGDSEYVRQLRRRFAGARFIESQGAREDFDLIRSAQNIVVAVSTFSWLAAWLSRAKTIILPLSGFLNPSHCREFDLLPADDIRYRFFLFPLNFGLPEKEALEHHQRMSGYWKEISRNQVALLKNAAPFLRTPRQNYDGGLPTLTARGAAITFDPVWYSHRYVDAAMEISEGWFEDPLHHYLEVGRLRGYLPTPPLQGETSVDLSLPNLAMNKRATQSSLSSWSKGSTLEEDAGNAVDGNPAGEYSFCTDNEPNPWWMVDLGSTAQIHFMRIFNLHSAPEWIQRRASPLVVEVSNDAEEWTLLFRTQPGQLFGGYSGGCPLIWRGCEPVEARFVRISIPRREYLHVAEVEVYGRFSDDRPRLEQLAKPQGDLASEKVEPALEKAIDRAEGEPVIRFYEQGASRFSTKLQSFSANFRDNWEAVTELCQIMKKEGSDKGLGWHNYTLFYDFMLKNRRKDIRNILEVGVYTGASLRGWREYFPNANIFGADIDKRILFSEPRISTFYVDQLQEDSIWDLFDKLGDIEFDLIIDDGLHTFEANATLITHSYRRLAKGGLYIIEDIAAQEHNLAKYDGMFSTIGLDGFIIIIPHLSNSYDNCVALFRR